MKGGATGGKKAAVFVPKPVQSLLSDLRSALMTDLTSAGPEEVRGNPILKERERLVVRIDRVLASATTTAPKDKPKAARRFDRYRVTLSTSRVEAVDQRLARVEQRLDDAPRINDLERRLAELEAIVRRTHQ